MPFVVPMQGVGPALTEALQREYGPEGLRVLRQEEGLVVLGPGWEFTVRSEDLYVYVCCEWGLPKDDERLAQLIRALLGAGLNVLDVQSETCWPAPSPGDWDPGAFHLWAWAEDGGA